MLFLTLPATHSSGAAPVKSLAFAVLLFAPCGIALAQTPQCNGVPLALPALSTSTLGLPVSSELTASGSVLGSPTGVLSQAYDEAYSVSRVLLRIKIEGCRSVANAIPPPSAIDPKDPAAYRPKTQWDNTPWRFNMTQNGKRMTADEFDAWMKAKGVRVVPRKPAATEAAAPAPSVQAQ